MLSGCRFGSEKSGNLIVRMIVSDALTSRSRPELLRRINRIGFEQRRVLYTVSLVFVSITFSQPFVVPVSTLR